MIRNKAFTELQLVTCEHKWILDLNQNEPKKGPKDPLFAESESFSSDELEGFNFKLKVDLSNSKQFPIHLLGEQIDKNATIELRISILNEKGRQIISNGTKNKILDFMIFII